jgi:tRNA(Ile)-lysidine synthase
LGLSVEETARVLRRRSFDDAYSKGLFDYIATAHHADDLVESVLLNLFRGTSVKGLKGISVKTDYIIRPLLYTKKSEIDEFVKTHDIPYREDSTNKDSAYTRNYLRNEILPNLKERFPSLVDGILRLSTIVENEDNFLDNLAKKFVFNDNGIVKIDLKCEKELLPRAIILALKEIGIKKDYEKKHANMLTDLSKKSNGTKLSLISGVTAIKEYDSITLYYKKETENLSIPFFIGEFSYQGKTYIIEKAESFNPNNNGVLYLNLDKIPNNAVIRNRIDGDKFKPFNAKTKKLKDYFIDKKIPVRIRDNFPLLALDNTVLAIFGLEISDQVKIDNNTKNIVKISVKE